MSGNDSTVTVAAWTCASCGRDASQWPHVSVQLESVAGSTRAAPSTGHSSSTVQRFARVRSTPTWPHSGTTTPRNWERASSPGAGDGPDQPSPVRPPSRAGVYRVRPRLRVQANPTQAAAHPYPVRPSRVVSTSGSRPPRVNAATTSPTTGEASVPRMNARTSPAMPPTVPARPSRPMPGLVTLCQPP